MIRDQKRYQSRLTSATFGTILSLVCEKRSDGRILMSRSFPSYSGRLRCERMEPVVSVR